MLYAKKNELKKLLIVLSVVLSGTLIAWYSNLFPLLGIDDANIYFVYMKNFSAGYGFVYNVGGERVEGFTSVLWTFIGSLYFYVGFKPHILLILTNIILITYSLWKLVCYTDNLLGDGKNLISPYSVLLLGGCIMVPGYLEWTVLSLLETGLWSSLLILTFLNTVNYKPGEDKLKNKITFGFLLVLLTLCRPEAVLWVGLFLLIRFVKVYLNTSSLKSSIISIYPFVLVFLFTFGALILWRLFYFGYPFPNTYYAKVSSDRMDSIKYGFYYIGTAVRNYPMILLCIILSSVVFSKICISKTIKDNLPFFSGLGVLLLTLFIPLFTGGDHFGYSRFFQPTMPIIGFLFIVSLSKLVVKMKYTYAFILLLLYSSNFVYDKMTIYENLIKQDSQVRMGWDIVKEYKEEKELLNNFFKDLPSYPSQGIISAGANAFYYKGQTNDLLGLNNVEMAHAEKDGLVNILKDHASFNKDVFFKQRPDLFFLAGGFVEKGEKEELIILDYRAKIYKNIHLDKRFKLYYTPVSISKEGDNHCLLVFASNSFLKVLDNYKRYSYKIISYKEMQ